MHWSEVWEGDSPSAQIARIALTPASLLYALGWQCYLGIYRVGLKRAYRARVPVVCVGNLTVGGMGKTPFAVALAKLLSRDRQVVIGCSGYGSPAEAGATLSPVGPLDASDWGDEAALLREELPDTPIIVGRGRVAAAQLCEKHFPDAVLLMDDGLQHMPLSKTVGIALVDPASKNAKCLPAGPYREPIGNRVRFDILVPGRYSVRYERTRLYSHDGSVFEPTGPVQAMCALGRPQQFFDSLGASGYSPIRTVALPDHDPFTRPDLLDRFDIDLPIVVTAKDWVKLKKRADLAGRTIIVARRNAQIIGGEDLVAEILKRIHEKFHATATGD